jgi:phage repressor protein C with HTH and peptisase S24 domain
MQPIFVENRNNSSPMLELRLRKAIDLVGGVSSMSEKSNYATSSIYNYVKLKVSPPIEFMWELINASGVRAEWMFTGQLPMMPGGTDISNDSASPAVGEKRIPIFDVIASAGHGSEDGHEQSGKHMSFPLKWLMELGDPDSMDIIKLEGDSMEPELRSGDHVMIDKSQTRLSDGLFAVSVDDHLFVKRVRVKGRLKADLVSVNPAYPPFEIVISDPKDPHELDQDAARIIGKVVWTGRVL